MSEPSKTPKVTHYVNGKLVTKQKPIQKVTIDWSKPN